MTVLMVANISRSKSDGISKKIISQAKSFSELDKSCNLICLDINGIYSFQFYHGVLKNEKCLHTFTSLPSTLKRKRESLKFICKLSTKLIKSGSFDVLYVRHMVPTFELISLLKTAKNKMTVFYEIPTYPYFFEQINSTENKLRTIIRLSIEMFFWPIIYQYIHRLIIIKSNSKVRVLKKMINSYNGFDKNNIVKKTTLPDITKMNIIGVGTIYPYHGYDKLIMAISKYVKNNGKIDIMFHIVGESKEISNLKSLVNDLHIESNIIFYGKQFGARLDEIFDNTNIGAGCLALEKRNADIDTSIKNIEYIARKMPFITNGNFYDFQRNDENFLKIDNNNIDLEKIFAFMQNYYDKKIYENSSTLIDCFEWKNINENILKYKN